MKISTRKLAISAILLAFDVIFSRVIALNLNIMKIGVGFAAEAVCAMLYGPWWTALLAALADLVGALAFPTGAYFPGFTVTAAISGLIFGFILYRRPVTWLRALSAATLNTVTVSWLCNTLLIAVWFSSKAYGALLAARAVQLAVMLPLQFIVIRALGASEKVFRKMSRE